VSVRGSAGSCGLSALFRLDELLYQLADARTAAMITGCEAAALRIHLAILTDGRPWWFC